MMRRSLLLLFLLCATVTAQAARRMTVAELEQMLAAEHTANRADATMAAQVAEIDLTEQLTAATRERMTASLKLGPQTAAALDLLSDSSALLSPPAAEIPADAKPDLAAQRAMIDGAIQFIIKTLRHLPDFTATRATRSFDDSPMVVGHSGYAPLTALHLVGTFNHDITYRDGHEVVDAPVEHKAKAEPGPAGLNTWGEFGPVLAVVLTDSTKGKVAWSRWEQSGTGPVAVFHYEVPKAASHYLVQYCCAWDAYGGSRSVDFRGTPGYHGDLYIDPKSGGVVRITLEAELPTEEVIQRAAISVEYGDVEIGDKTYLCPVRSVAISAANDRVGKTVGGETPVTRVNEVTFTHYHRFGSVSRILAGPVDAGAAGAPDAAAAGGAQVSGTTEPTAGSSDATQAPTGSGITSGEPGGPEGAPDVMAPAANAPAESATKATAPSAPAATTSDAAKDSAAPQTQSANADVASQEPVIKTTTSEVVVDVVVTKGNGDPVMKLGQQDFVVTEDGKPQTVDFFEEHRPDAPVAGAAPEMPPLPSDAETNVPPAPPSDAVNVLLLDTLNTPQQDQIYVHNQVKEFLTKMQPGTRLAIFILGSKLRFVQGFTSDTALLLAALSDRGNGTLAQKDVSARDRGDQADDAADISRMQMMQVSGAAIEAVRQAQADQANYALGARISMTFEALDALARYLSGVPGRKNLMWFSSSFPVTIFPTTVQRQSMEHNPSVNGMLTEMKKTADLMTVSKIAVYPIGAQGVMEEHILEANAAGPGTAEGAGHAGSNGDVMGPFTAGASERAGAIAGMEQLASSTGGKAFYNTNDLNGALRKAINDGASYYTLGYAPIDKRKDGGFRAIDVKLTQGKYKLSYRRGYNADDPRADAMNTKIDPIAPLLALGMPSASGLLYGVTARPLSDQPDAGAALMGQNKNLAGAKTRYAVSFIVRTQDVGLDAVAAGGRKGKLLVGLKAYDRDGNAVNWQAGMEMLNIEAAEWASLEKKGLAAQLEIDLPSGTALHLVTAVYDVNSGRAGSVEIPIAVKP